MRHAERNHSFLERRFIANFRSSSFALNIKQHNWLNCVTHEKASSQRNDRYSRSPATTHAAVIEYTKIMKNYTKKVMKLSPIQYTTTTTTTYSPLLDVIKNKLNGLLKKLTKNFQK